MSADYGPEFAEQVARWVATGEPQTHPPPRPPDIPAAAPFDAAFSGRVARWVETGEAQPAHPPVMLLEPHDCQRCGLRVCYRVTYPAWGVTTVDVPLEGSHLTVAHRCSGLPAVVRFPKPPPKKREPREWEITEPYEGAPAPLRPIAVKGLRGAYRVE